MVGSYSNLLKIISKDNYMDSETIALAIGVTAFLHWYFNIRSKSKCIQLDQKCNSIKCLKQKNI